MTDGLEFEGKDLAAALGAAAARLGTPPGSLRYEVLEEGRRGLLGLGSRPCRIRVQAPAACSRGLVGGEAAIAGGAECPPPLLVTIRRMLDLMGFEIDVTGRQSTAGVTLTLSGRDRQALLARDGEVLSALQFLLNRMGRRAWPEAGPVRVSCQGAGSRRDDEVVEIVREVSSQVTRTGRSKRLHPMNPYERRLAHLTVREFPGLASRSEGTGFLKRIVVEKVAGPRDDDEP